MEKLVEKIKDILEIDDLDVNVKFEDLDEWDSLSVLTVLSMLDSDYRINMSKKELNGFASIAEFLKYVETKAK